MKPKFKKFNWLVKLITFNWPLAITIFPFGIYVNQKYRTLETVSERTKNHECIHWAQQIEMFVAGLILSALASLMFISVSFNIWILLGLILFPFLFFYLWYLLEFIVDLFIWGKLSYVNSTFEREAYDNDENFDYLKTRKHFSFLRYVKKKHKKNNY